MDKILENIALSSKGGRLPATRESMAKIPGALMKAMKSQRSADSGIEWSKIVSVYTMRWFVTTNENNM